MEEEKRKRKNKKKKNKQQGKSAAEDSAVNAAGIASSREVTDISGPNHLGRSVESGDGVEDDGSNVNVVEKSGHSAEATNCALSADTGKQNWLQEEARLRDMVKQLLYEKDSYIQRETYLEMKVKQLQCENDSWHEKEVILEQRISQLLAEQASLSSGKTDLQEKIRHIEKERALFVEKESSSKEMIAELSNENNRLQMQVVELEKARISISQENRQLIENISTLDSQIQDLERTLASTQSSLDAQKDAFEREDLNAQMEAACALVEKLVTENADLVEKMNELYMELGSRNMAGDVASVMILDYTTVRDPTSASNEAISSSAVKAPTHSETVAITEEQQYDVYSNYTNNVAWDSSETTMSGEIVQIPLDEYEAQNQDLEALPPSINAGNQDLGGEEEDLALTDAPLIGAPFRLISFVTRYVSGADLVSKSSSDSLQKI